MCCAIVDGTVGKIAKEAIGPQCQARWLTLAGRALRLYCSMDAANLSEYVRESLTRIVNYIICVYYKVYIVIV
jgi:hypothetical protein